MQCNKAVESSKNVVSDTSKFQSFFISLCNLDNEVKSLILSLSANLKAFQCKETGVQVSTDNGWKIKSNSCEKKDGCFYQTFIRYDFFIESICKYL